MDSILRDFIREKESECTFLQTRFIPCVMFVATLITVAATVDIFIFTATLAARVSPPRQFLIQVASRQILIHLKSLTFNERNYA